MKERGYMSTNSVVNIRSDGSLVGSMFTMMDMRQGLE